MIFSVDVKEARFEYGDKLYRVEEKRTRSFDEPCKICDDTKKITYRGFTFDCPFCGNYHNRRNGIFVKEFTICEYFINKITVEGEPLKKNFSPSTAIFDNPPRVKYEAFTRTGNGYTDLKTATVYCDEWLDPTPDDYIKKYRDRAFFTDKKKAQETLALMNKLEREKFDTFCRENGCTYEFPF